MTPENPAFDSIFRLAPLVERKEISPVEVTRLHLDRIERLNSEYLAYLDVFFDEAMASSRLAEMEIQKGRYRGPLHGMPIALKDLFHVKGTGMTCGSKAMTGYVSVSDATVHTKLMNAGSILLGKLNMHEFAWGGTSRNLHCGTPRNPWDKARLPGGSSGGCAVAVAAGLAMGTLGTDTGGSVRIPASLSGIVGLKPTYGRVSRYGVYPLSESCDHVGPMVRNVADAAILLQAVAGPDDRDPTTSSNAVPDYMVSLKEDVRGLKLGIPRTFFFEDIQPEVHEAVDVAISHFETLGARVFDITIPSIEHVIASSTAIMTAEAYEIHADRLRESSEKYGDDVKIRLLLGACIDAEQYLKAQRFRRLLLNEMMGVFAGVDAMLTPTTLLTACNIDDLAICIGQQEYNTAAHLARVTRPFNMTGLPAISVPCGFTPNDLPIGLQIVGRPFDESTILHLAYAYERSTPWHEKRPNVSG